MRPVRSVKFEEVSLMVSEGVWDEQLATLFRRAALPSGFSLLLSCTVGGLFEGVKAFVSFIDGMFQGTDVTEGERGDDNTEGV